MDKLERSFTCHNHIINSLEVLLFIFSSFSDMKKKDIEKFKKYEIEGNKYLIPTCFSDKTISGGNIFDVKTTKDGETSKVSRFPGHQSYANFNDGSSSASTPNSTSETPSNVRKRKYFPMRFSYLF
ncbi:uncharacterized protein [Solanum lycopersicum]|uniref:uncharacterized protein isoform X1 n=1 Tax=Solanum lycopersicum TaxID=4081 RepID=UPI000532E206|nr:uncharacterized protein LOC101262126 isoform X1 [Solanum lycopersicum]XP_010322590.1 uncharacterized protein LOC101262126 isoform X1 [Solanum lycopersicum]XP_010322591.1 uncharacterized protein LOC101262126 isoform X1 [Solanum lycopersicum]XP_010322593.1 uncharacterized protein LOC101262126 isoform X1 [Solanum lycopersicum]XP_010322594.1 uncharacterized protein LOC101262126 isoform X1 [Solanum lycopersicum]XP_010322596.1 uncharacterized protein LOC101262126 isoform X1 [Solanum lycopersicum]